MENKTTIGQLALRFLLICAALFVAQWFVPYYLLAAGAIIGGIFTATTSPDARNGWVIVAAGIFIAVIGYVSVAYWQPVVG